MVARIACLALALGILVGCYDIPKPECGFACGPAAACPSDYTCNTAVNRCQLDGTTPTCAPAFDAGTDVGDVTAPSVISQIPLDGSSDASPGVIIMARFDEPVVGVTGASFRLEQNGTPIGGFVTYVPTIDSANFEPVSPLAPATVYTAILTTAITDTAGNPLASEVRWSFTTAGDLLPPLVVTQAPGIGATSQAVIAVVVADFNEPVFGVSATSFTLTQGVTPVAGTVAYISAAYRATFTPTVQLDALTTYTARLTSDITDASFNSLTPVTWSFTTGPDTIGPRLASLTPGPGTTGVSVTTAVSVSFDEPALGLSDTSFTLTPQGGSPVAATVGYASGTRTATLTPTLQLAANTLHTATLTAAITDGATNALQTAPATWSFTTGADTLGPRVATTTPADQATAVPTSSTIVVQFDEPVQGVTTTSFTVNGGAITGTLSLSAGNTLATFTPDAALPAAATISVALTTAITDGAANPLAAPVTFSFTTAP